MKTLKIVFSLILFLLVVSAFSAGPVSSYTDGSPVWSNNIQGPRGTDSFYGSNAVEADTLGATDSTVLYSGIRPPDNWNHILRVAPLTGTGADSVVMLIRVDCYDSDDNLWDQTVVDTINEGDGDYAVLPFGTTVFGAYYNIKAITTTGSGGQIILNRHRISKYKAIVNQRPSGD